MQQMIDQIAALIEGIPHSRRMVAIDGRCGSGKTTLAADLQERFGCPVIHMDDFFLRPEQRTPQRLQTPGENIDHERFLAEVLLPLKQTGACVYRPYDCHTGQLTSPVSVPAHSLYIIEGSYACHPSLWEHYDRRLFLSVNKEEQLRRIAARSGEAAVAVFRERWIPLEEAYFAAFDIPGRCDVRLGT